MKPYLNRRDFLCVVGALLLAPQGAGAESGFKPLRAVRRMLEVRGRPASVYALEGADRLGLIEGGKLRLRLQNEIGEGTVIHWHGLTPPGRFDGTLLSQDLVQQGDAFDYDFNLNRSGTHWMHSHAGLQAQKLLAAPMIVRSREDLSIDEQEHVLMLHDFSFRETEEIFAELKSGRGGHAAHTGHGASAVALNDVNFDAYLANDRTLADPELIRTDPGGRLRLRIINGCAASNMLIDLGALEGSLIAIDGNPVVPIRVRRFGLAAAQRADMRIQMPPEGGSFPVLARPEGTNFRTGIILASRNAPIRRLEERGDEETPAVRDIALEAQLGAIAGLQPKAATRTAVFDLGGGGADYSWDINGSVDHAKVIARVVQGERVEWLLRNQTAMSHPMHLHGHHFQVVGVKSARFEGAMRDTVLVPAHGEVTIAFDADNPGRWPFHCHHLYHFHAGMAGAIDYET